MPNQYRHPEWKRWLNHAAALAFAGVLAQVVALVFPGPFYWLFASPIYMAAAGALLALRFARECDPGVSKRVFVGAHAAAQVVGAVLGFLAAELRDSNGRSLAGTCLLIGLSGALVAGVVDALLYQRAARRQVQAS